MQTAAAAHSIPLARDYPLAHDYQAFGGVLRSAIEFPELSPAKLGVRPDWTLIVQPGAPPPHTLAKLGERHVRAERYELWRSPYGFRLSYSHAGVFDISAAGTQIVWYRRNDAVLELVRSIVLGPAIALALELAGLLCLHGSAVALHGGAVGFVGPKHYGKSTIATALTTAGGQLIGDDLLVVRPGPPTTVRPGVASVRLWPDIAAALPLDTVCDTLITGVKTTATGFVEQAVISDQCLLKAVYVLWPVARDAEARAAWRSRLAPTEATISLAHQTKLPDTLVGLRGAGAQLALAAAVAANVPVWRLHILRDVAKLDAVVQQITDWSAAE
jgi:hypothetical protein